MAKDKRKKDRSLDDAQKKVDALQENIKDLPNQESTIEVLNLLTVENAISPNLIKKPETFRKLSKGLDVSRLISSNEGPKFLSQSLNIPVGFTIESLRNLCLKLNHEW